MCLSIEQKVIAAITNDKGSGCGSVGRAVASNTKVHQFESIQQKILFTVDCKKCFTIVNGLCAVNFINLDQWVGMALITRQ